MRDEPDAKEGDGDHAIVPEGPDEGHLEIGVKDACTVIDLHAERDAEQFHEGGGELADELGVCADLHGDCGLSSRRRRAGRTRSARV